MRDEHRHVLDALSNACRNVYGARLVSLVVFGSIARGVAGPDSDVDVLVIAEHLPNGRMKRVAEFAPIDELMREPLRVAGAQGWRASISPIFKTRPEVEHGSLLLLDMVDHAVILADQDDFFAKRILRLRGRLEELGSKRLPYRGGYYWLLKPDYKPGDVIEL